MHHAPVARMGKVFRFRHTRHRFGAGGCKVSAMAFSGSLVREAPSEYPTSHAHPGGASRISPTGGRIREQPAPTGLLPPLCNPTELAGCIAAHAAADPAGIFAEPTAPSMMSARPSTRRGNGSNEILPNGATKHAARTKPKSPHFALA